MLLYIIPTEWLNWLITDDWVHCEQHNEALFVILTSKLTVCQTDRLVSNELQQSARQQAQTVNADKFVNFMKKIENYLKQEMV